MKRYRSKKTRSNLFFHRAVRKGFVTFDSRILKEGREEMESWQWKIVVALMEISRIITHHVSKNVRSC